MDYNWHSLLASLECSNIIPVWPIAFSPVEEGSSLRREMHECSDSAWIKIHQSEKGNLAVGVGSGN